jgi:hypothetical protein
MISEISESFLQLTNQIGKAERTSGAEQPLRPLARPGRPFHETKAFIFKAI